MIARASIFCVFSAIFCLQVSETLASCSSPSFQCRNSEICLSRDFVCDGVKDCSDGSDESFCAKNNCEGKYQCKTQNKCIPVSYLCDSYKDCADGDDESDALCLVNQCKVGKNLFRCRQQINQCVANEKVCDGIIDCRDGTDELDCITNSSPSTLQCKSDEFQCVDHSLCIPKDLRCDHIIDCLDGTDEKSCLNNDANNTCTSPSHFACIRGNKCVLPSQLCDGHKDCEDGSDEHVSVCDSLNNNNASSSPCKIASDFYCGPNDPVTCIAKSWRCDGSPDCANGLDEMHCAAKQCAEFQFLCNNKQECISNTLMCNSHSDCSDRSDEENCGPKVKQSTCKLDKEFDCIGDGTLCIPLSKMCDNFNDCGVNEDEKPGGAKANCQTNLCRVNNGNCSHGCANHYYKRICYCPIGYRLSSDNRTCVDINECEELQSPCSHFCHNVKGDYKCLCASGYSQNPIDKSQCIAAGERVLLYGSYHSIRLTELQGRHLRTVLDKTLHASVLDFKQDKTYNFSQLEIFFSEVVSGDIKLLKLHTGEIITLLSQKKSIIEGLAYDWMNGLLYGTDASEPSLFVLNVTSGEKFTLLKNGVDHPRAIVVDPEMGQLYWTDWGKAAKIESMGMNGQDRKVLVDKSIFYPNGLAMDYATRHLYWSDSKLHMLSSFDLTTHQRQVILQHADYYPFSVEVFEDRLYWGDWLKKSIQSINKKTGKDLLSVAPSEQPMGVRIVHQLRQPTSNSPPRCNNHQCSHLCLPAPTVGLSKVLYTCACPDGWGLLSDGRSCTRGTANNTVLENGDRTNLVNKTSPPAIEHNNGARIGRITALVSLLLLALLVGFFVAGYGYYRYRQRKLLGIVHFDNPVYRKSIVNNHDANNGADMSYRSANVAFCYAPIDPIDGHISSCSLNQDDGMENGAAENIH